jgi:hypothetical protein
MLAVGCEVARGGGIGVVEGEGLKRGGLFGLEVPDEQKGGGRGGQVWRLEEMKQWLQDAMPCASGGGGVTEALLVTCPWGSRGGQRRQPRARFSCCDRQFQRHNRDGVTDSILRRVAASTPALPPRIERKSTPLSLPPPMQRPRWGGGGTLSPHFRYIGPP